MPENFSELYKSYHTVDLLAILEKSEQYQPVAVQAAENELRSRQLTREELDKQIQELVSRRVNESNSQSDSVKAKAISKGRQILNRVNPFDFRHPEGERIIRATIFWNAILYLILLITRYKEPGYLLSYMLSEPLVSLVGFIPFVFYPIAVIGFALRKKVGWHLLSLFFSFIAINYLWSFFGTVLLRSQKPGLLDIYIEKPATIDLLLPIVISTLTLFAICKPEVRQVYKISKLQLKYWLIFSAILSVALVYLIS